MNSSQEIICQRCLTEECLYKLKFFPNPAYTRKRDPKYAFHVSAICIRCEKHIKFIQQTEEVMKVVQENHNKQLNDFFGKEIF